RVRAAHPARGAGPLGALRRARAALDGGPRAQPLHRSRSTHSQRRGELPGAFRVMTTLAVLLVAAAALATGAVLGALVVQLRAALERTEAQVQSLECERREAFATLRTQIETLAGGQAQLQRETRNLATALRRPEVRGRWGELTLRRLVELAGLTEHCDFTEQLQVVGEGGSLRPDLVVHMPDARDLVIDAKTPLEAFLTALDAQS